MLAYVRLKWDSQLNICHIACVWMTLLPSQPECGTAWPSSSVQSSVTNHMRITLSLYTSLQKATLWDQMACDWIGQSGRSRVHLCRPHAASIWLPVGVPSGFTCTGWVTFVVNQSIMILSCGFGVVQPSLSDTLLWLCTWWDCGRLVSLS